MIHFLTLISPIIDRVFKDPVAKDTRDKLQMARSRLAEKHRTPNQFFGGHYAGCGATIGLMPRCDFACRGCYLNKDANQTPRATLSEIKRQLRQIRDWLGYGGNVQITDGEATLLPVDELIEIICFARRIGLVPMLMSHGDLFLKNPGLLDRLIIEGGLSELCIHIDSTQRGRHRKAYRFVDNEHDLMPLRDQFAALIRDTRRNTGKCLEVATTMTVTRDNIAQIPDILRWLRGNADAFKMISFQPVAQVGRTEMGAGAPVSVEELWNQITRGLFDEPIASTNLLKHKGLFGHPDCTCFVQGLNYTKPNSGARFFPLFRGDDDRDRKFLVEYFDSLGGVSFRLDTTVAKAIRLMRMIAIRPQFMMIEVPRFILRRFSDISEGDPIRLFLGLISRRHRLNYLNIVSHHFMNAAELATPAGRERENSCVFKVPIGNEMVSMCAVNALGYRSRYYEDLRVENAHKNLV